MYGIRTRTECTGIGCDWGGRNETFDSKYEIIATYYRQRLWGLVTSIW